MTVFQMIIGDIRDIPAKGVAAVGANSDLDRLSCEEISRMIPEEVLIETRDGQEVVARVVRKEVSTSILDKKNIALLLEPRTGKTRIAIGSRVRGRR